MTASRACYLSIYPPTNLTTSEIAGKLSVARNAVKTRMRNLYTELSTHRLAGVLARALELLVSRR